MRNGQNQIRGLGIFEMSQMSDSEIDSILAAEQETEAELYDRIRKTVQRRGYRTTGNLEQEFGRGLALAGSRVA